MEEGDVNVKITIITKKVETIELRKINLIKANEKVKDICGICETNGYQTQDYPISLAFQEVLHEQDVTPPNSDSDIGSICTSDSNSLLSKCDCQ